MFLGSGNIEFFSVKDDLDQQRLHGNAIAIELVFQVLIDDTLVRSVHIDDDEAVLVLCKNENAGQLRQREAERRCLAVGSRLCDFRVRCRRRLQIAEQRLIGVGRLGNP